MIVMEDVETEVQVVDWRREALENVGVRKPIAAILAATDADLHVMLDAKLAGATDAQLKRIFT